MGSIRTPIGALTALADADDLDGTNDNSQTLDVTGAAKAIIMIGPGTLGTAGVDVLQESHNDGETWADCTTLRDSAGDLTAVDGKLNDAGLDAVLPADMLFSAGPFNGPTLLRVCRDTSDSSTTTAIDWITGAPSVSAIRVG